MPIHYLASDPIHAISVDEADVAEALENGDLSLKALLVTLFRPNLPEERIAKLHDEVTAAVAEMSPEARLAFDRFCQAAFEAEHEGDAAADLTAAEA